MKIKLRENKILLTRLLTEAIVDSEADHFPGFVPKSKWKGTYAKYEELIKKIGGRPYPLPFATEKSPAAYEVNVGDDIVRFYENGEAYSTNNATSFQFGVDPKYKGITLYDASNKKDIKGAIEFKNGKSTWTPVSSGDAMDTEEGFVDYLQTGLTVVGIIPGYGDIADIINAAISFARGNYLDGFLNLIGAIPIVGSALAIPLKLLLKGWNKAGDFISAAWKSRKSADEVWSYIETSGKLGRREMDLLVKGMGNVADYMNQFKNSAKSVLPNSAYKALGEFADFMRKQGDGASAIFANAGKTAAEASKFGTILKVRKEVNQLGGLKRVLGGGVFRRLRNIFTTALGPTELKALKGVMFRKFAKNMDNPSKLNVLLHMSPNQAKLLTEIGTDLGSYINKMPANDAARFFKGMERYINKGNIPNAKVIEKQLEYFKSQAPELYTSTMNKLVKDASTSMNPMYTQFMNSEVNALGSYFSRGYAESAGLQGAMSRWSNMVPIIWNEMSDMGEDVLMAAGIETKDDVNGLFYPAIKSILNFVTDGYVGDVIAPKASNALKTARGLPLIGPAIDIAANIAGANTGKQYDPNIEFEIVPEDDPRIKQQEKEKQQRIDKNRRY